MAGGEGLSMHSVLNSRMSSIQWPCVQHDCNGAFAHRSCKDKLQALMLKPDHAANGCD